MKRLLYIFLACLCLAACKKTTVTDSALSLDSLYITADTIYEDEMPLLTDIRLMYGNTLVFYDSITFFETNSEQIIPYSDTVLYFLINEFDPVSMKSLHVIRVSNYRVSKKVVYGQIIKDIDGDSIFEIIGQELVEAACFHCDSSYYSPILVYKLGLYCIYDEKLSEELTIQKYGCYLGKECFDTILSTEDFEYNGIEL